jgi:TP901 family phage tail tape measure protein
VAAVFDILMRLDTSGFSRGARSAQQDADKFTDSLKNMAGFLAGIGLVEVGRQALTVSTDFDDALTQINTLVGESREQIAEWRGELLKMGPELGKGPVELAKALYSITGAGARGAEALEIMRQAALASSLGMGDTQTVAKAVVATLEAYGRQAITAAEATETLRNAVREGNLEASELAPALGKVTGLAASMGVSFAEVSGFIAKFTKSGGSAAEGVTGLRGVLNTFLSATQDTKDVLADLGLSLDGVRASIREKGLAATLVDLFERIGDNKTALSQLFPSVEALSSALNVIASDSGADYLSVIGRVATLNNDLASTFDMVRKANPGQALRDLSAIGESLQISLGDGLANALMRGVAGLGDLEQQQIAAEQIGKQLGEVLALLIKALDFVADNADMVAAAFKAWMALKFIGWINGGVAALQAMAAAEAGAAAGMTLMTGGLAAVLIGVLAINEAIKTWSATMQREIDTMVEQAAMFAKAMGDTKKAVALAIASNNQGTISDELAAQREAYSQLSTEAEKYRQQLAANAAEQERLQKAIDGALGDSGQRGQMRAQIEELKAGAAVIQTSLNEVSAQAGVTSAGIQDLFAALQTAGAGATATATTIATLSDSLKDFFKDSNAELAQHQALMMAMGASGDQAAQRLAKIRAAIESGLDPLGDMTDAWRANLTELALIQAAIDAGLDPMKDMSAAVVAQLKLVVASRVEWVLWSKKVADVRGETLDLLQQIQGLSAGRKVIEGLAKAQREFEKATILAKIAELALSDSFQETLKLAGVTLQDLFDQINAGFAAMAGAQDPVEQELFDLTYAAENMLEAYAKGPAAVAALTLEQERAAEKTRILSKLTEAQKIALGPTIEAWLDYKEALDVAPEMADLEQQMKLVQAQLAVDPHAFNSLEDYRAALARVRLEAEITSRIDATPGATPEQIQTIRDYYTAIHQGQQILEQRNVETVWQAGVRGMSEALQKGLTDAGTTAINEWVEIGDSFVENLLESLIEAFASAALQAAISSAFSGQGGGFWGNLASSFTGGGGGAGGGGGGGWMGYASSAYGLYRNGAGAWGAISGGSTAPAWTSTFVNNGANGVLGPTASGGNLANGTLTTAGTAVAVAAVGAAIIYAFKLYLDKREEKQYRDVGQSFYMGYGINPRDPVNTLPPVDRSGTGPANTGGGGQNNDGLSFLVAGSQTGPGAGQTPIGRLNVPEIQTKGSLGSMIGAEGIEQLRKLIHDNTLGLIESLGGMVKGLGEFNLQIRNDGEQFKVTVGGIEQTFKTIEEAISAGIAEMLDAGEFEGLSENIETVLDKANELGLEGLNAALLMAQEADHALAKSIGGVAEGVGIFEAQAKALEVQLAAVEAEARKLGLTEESIAALLDQRRHQLEMEQQILGGQALTSLLGNLFNASAAAAGDAELAAMYTYELGAIRKAQLEMEAAEFLKLGYISDEVFARIQGYIAALDPTAVGNRINSGGWSGGNSGYNAGQTQRDNEAEARAREEAARAERKAELEKMIADMAMGLNDAAAAAMQKGRDIRAAIEEMNELELDPALIEQFWQLSKGEAIRAFLEGANKVIADAGRSDLATRRAEMDAFWNEQILAAYQLGAELGVAGDELAAPIIEAARIQQAALAEEAVGQLSLPLEQTRRQAQALTDTLDYLRSAAADGSMSIERFAHVLLQTQAQTEHALLGMAAGLLEQTGNEEDAAEARARMAEIEFDISVAQLRLFYQMALAAGALTETAQANLERFLTWIEDPANRPDFTVPAGGGPNNVPEPANDNQAQDLESLRQSVLDQLQAWRDLALDPVTKAARDLNAQLAETRANAIKAGIAISEVNAAFAFARADFIRQQLAPYAAIGNEEQAGYDALNQHFDDVRQAFIDIGASAKDLAELEEARLRALGQYMDQIDASSQSLLDRLLGGDLATGTKRQQFEAAQANFQALAARLAANPQDLEARAAIGAAGERLLQAAQAYNSGALFNDMAALVQQVLMGILGGGMGNLIPFPIPGGGGPNDLPTRQGGGLSSPFVPTKEGGGAADVRHLQITPGETRVIGILGEIRDALRGVTGAVETGNRDRAMVAGATADGAERLRRTVDEKLGDLPNDLARAIGGRR